MMPDQPLNSPLDGIRVLDFSIMLAGPYCARLLADVGAEVIKIEPPEGEEMRLRAPLRDGQSAYFGQLNAGKKRSRSTSNRRRRSGSCIA
jgi:CoA:oxalate CoA-transferase